VSLAPASLLERALEVSREVLAAADRGECETAASLDAERLLLLQSARRSGQMPGARELELLREIARLNDQSIGHLEHHRRIKGRQLDVAAVGRRAVTAYGNTRFGR
jgi:hypothetical protein